MSDANILPQEESGRGAAFVVYALYILSIPSAAFFAVLGLIVAYASRGTAGALALTHLNAQIRLFWIAFLWNVAIGVVFLLSWVLTIVLIGFPLMWLCGIAFFIVLAWFTIKSILGCVALVDRRAV
ncbi:MAG: hypothetical protein AB7O04_07280 [Hyphomonadaceae bacterium]